MNLPSKILPICSNSPKMRLANSTMDTQERAAFRTCPWAPSKKRWASNSTPFLTEETGNCCPNCWRATLILVHQPSPPSLGAICGSWRSSQASPRLGRQTRPPSPNSEWAVSHQGSMAFMPPLAHPTPSLRNCKTFAPK